MGPFELEKLGRRPPGSIANLSLFYKPKRDREKTPASFDCEVGFWGQPAVFFSYDLEYVPQFLSSDFSSENGCQFLSSRL